MGNLTDDMTRLRGEVDTLRGVRGALMNDLMRGARDLTTAVAAMRADFTSTHTAMAKKTGKERETFVAAVIDEVNSLLDGFSRDRNDMARTGRRDRGVFLSEMRRHVTGLCKETADDMMGARLAWRGEHPGKSRPVRMKKEPVVVKPVSPPVEAAPKKTAEAPKIKTEKLPLTFKEPPKEKRKKKTVAAPMDPVATPHKVKGPLLVSNSKPPFQMSKKKNLPDEKSAKTLTRGKRGRK